jgi:hypothetical protein
MADKSKCSASRSSDGKSHAGWQSFERIHYNGAFMLVFRIHRMKENPRQQFRWAPHVSGVANVKPKDYEAAGEIEAENEYAAWALLRGSETPLMVGDLLELATGQLRICKYVGFEEARWFLPEPVAIPSEPAQAPQSAQVQ